MNDIEKIKKEYKLNKDEYEEMYQNARKIVFQDAKTYKNPIAIIVGGQTGAGKGGIDVYSKKEFKKQKLDSIVIDVDSYRMLHPRGEEIVKKYPTWYNDITAQETGPIAKALLQETIEKGYNFIFEGTMKNTEILETMKKMPKNYNKIVRVIATSPKESLLTAFERNEEQVEAVGYGRFTNVDVHDFSYEGVAKTLKIIEESKVPDRIQIFTRGKDIVSPELVYDSNREKNEYNTAYESLIVYRKINEERMKQTITDRLNKLLNERTIDSRELEQREKLRRKMRM
jgi:UDP-N-acetylglucosamine kinase